MLGWNERSADFFYCKPILASSVLLLVNGPTEHWIMCYRVVTDHVTVWSIKNKFGSTVTEQSQGESRYLYQLFSRSQTTPLHPVTQVTLYWPNNSSLCCSESPSDTTGNGKRARVKTATLTACSRRSWGQHKVKFPLPSSRHSPLFLPICSFCVIVNSAKCLVSSQVYLLISSFF